MRRPALFASFAAAVTACVVTPAPAGGPLPIFYTTPPPSSDALGLVSRTAPGGQQTETFRRVADNFQLPESARIQAITWWGGMQSSLGELQNVASFTIEFFDNTGPAGGPGKSLGSSTLLASQIATSMVTPAQTIGDQGAILYTYSAFLTSGSVELLGGRTYWVSIAATLWANPDGQNEAWTWSSGANTTSDVSIAEDHFDGQGFQLRKLGASNTAFTLMGNSLAPPCFGDANSDNIVNGADLSVLLSNFGMTTENGAASGDFNTDGAVNGADLSVLLARFGTEC